MTCSTFSFNIYAVCFSTFFQNQSLDEIVRKYSIQTNIDPSHLRLQFDGDILSLDDTPDELELEDGYCLDIIHLT